jgi:RND superfamily putative drug exporter
MTNLLQRLGGFAARRHWIFIIAWLVILGGTLWARHASGGEFVNNYSVSGSGSALGQDLLNNDFPQQGGYAGMDLVASAAHAEATSGAAIVVAGGTVVVSILGLYVSGVAFVGALGLAAAIVVAITMWPR